MDNNDSKRLELSASINSMQMSSKDSLERDDNSINNPIKLELSVSLNSKEKTTKEPLEKNDNSINISQRMELGESLESEEKKSKEAREESYETNDNSINTFDDLEEHNKYVYLNAWSKKLLYVAYGVLILTAFVETFANNSTSSLDSYATSSFNEHALIATVAVVYKITAICAYPILAKIADFLGRAEGFTLSMIFYTLAYILYASCQNADTYVSAEIFFAIGRNGYRIFQLIFIADTTSLINRGILSQLPNAIGAIPSLYAGSYVQDAFLEHSTWRWGYGCFAIILAASCFPLGGIMFYLDRVAKKRGQKKIYQILADIPKDAKWYQKAYQIFVIELDLPGGILLLCGFALFFVPFTVTGKSSSYKWHEPKLIVMLVLGFCIFCGFLVWNSRFAKKPFVPTQALKSRTVVIIVVLVALDLCENSSFATYFKTVLQVAGFYSAGEATRIDNSKKVTVDIFNVFGGILMKYTKRSKIYTLIGIPMLVLGHGLLVWFMRRGDGEMASYALLVMAEVFIGFGRGMYQCALQVTIQAIAGIEGIAMSTAFFLAFQSIGSLIGSAISGGIWNTIVLNKLGAYLPVENKGEAKKIYKSITVAMSYEKGSDARNAINKAYSETIQIIGWTGLGIIAPMLVLMFFVKEVKLSGAKDIYDSQTSDVEIENEDVEKELKDKEEEPSKFKEWYRSFRIRSK